MKFLSVRDLKTKSSQVWKELAGQKEMIVTSNGRPIALLSSINENNLEQVLTAFRRARATNAVASIQYESTQKPDHPGILGLLCCQYGRCNQCGSAGTLSV